LASNSADLDKAYILSGHQVPKLDRSTGNSRVAWATLDQAGELLVNLSALPVRDPAAVAVIEPLSGALLRVISAEMPVSITRVDKYNPQGRLTPGQGAPQATGC
jgi:hypothetical protein